MLRNIINRIGIVLFLLIVVGLALTPSVLRYVYYHGFLPNNILAIFSDPVREYASDEIPEYTGEGVVDVDMPPRNEFIDNPTVGEGVILLDMAHGNNFRLSEIGSLDARLAARGYDFIHYESGDLSRQLRGVDAFVVIAPLNNYSEKEIAAVTDFVDDGGRLLLMGDPTRFTVEFIEDDFGFIVDFEFVTNELALNDLANEYDIAFQGDYLYNLTNSGNESNFRNIVITSTHIMGDNALVDGLDTVVLYGAHSIEVGANATAVFGGGSNTYSSATDRAGGLTVAAMSANEQVLAMGDLTFLDEPYFTSLDNERLIAQVADFLTAGATTDRAYELTDFPYFFENGTIELNYVGEVDLGPDAFDDIIRLQNNFGAVGQTLQVTGDPSGENNVLHLGLYNQALTDEAVLDILAEAGLELIIDPPVLTADELKAQQEAEEAAAEEAEEENTDSDAEDEESEGVELEIEEEEPEVVQLIASPMGNIEMAGTAVVLLHETDGRYEVIVLASSKEGMENTVDRLLDLMPLDADYSLEDCLTSTTIALCPTDVSDEPVEAELITGTEPEQQDDDQDDSDEENNDESAGEEIDEPEPEEDIYRPSIDDLEPIIDQGTIGAGEEVAGTFAVGEFHAWVYSGDEITADILATSGTEIDMVLEIYDAEGLGTEYADSGFSGDPESLNGIVLAEGYTIVVNDFGLDNEGDYAISVSISEETADESGESEDSVEEVPADEESAEEEETNEEVADEGEETIDEGEEESDDSTYDIFLYIDNNGDFLGADQSETIDVASLFDESVSLTVWDASTGNNELTLEDLDGIELIIWYSGEYREEDLDFEDEANLLLESIFFGNDITLVTIGSTSPMLEPAELVALESIEFLDTDFTSALGFTAGEIALEGSYETTLFELTAEDTIEGQELVAVRPDGDNAGDAQILLVSDEFVNILFFGLPLNAFATEDQANIIMGIVDWFAPAGE